MPFQPDSRYPLHRSYLVRTSWYIYSEGLTMAGRWLLWTTVCYLYYLGSLSLDLQVFIPFSYALGIWMVAVGAVPFVRPRVNLKSRHADRVSAGETLTVDLEVEAGQTRWPAPLYVVPHRLPPEISARPAPAVAVPPLQRGDRARVQMGLSCSRRGAYLLKGFRIATSFPLGLLQSHRTFPFESTLLVYPGFQPLSDLEVSVGRRHHPGGLAMASSRGDSMEMIGNREYREGDNVRNVDWRATARLAQPIVREYREEFFFRAALILDSYLPIQPTAAQAEAFEQAISLCASVGEWLCRHDYLVDLLAVGPSLYHLTAGRSLASLDMILEILACVESVQQEPFQELASEVLISLAQISSAVCIFLEWDSSREALVEQLIAGGAGVKIILVTDRPTAIPFDLGSHPGSIVLTSSLIRGGIDRL